MDTEIQGSGTTPAAEAPAATTPSATEFSSFLGVEATELPSLRPVQNPEPAGTETPATENVSEPEAAAEGEAELEAAPEETFDDEAQPELEATDEIADDWLPNEQEKEFPVEVLVKYAKRYGYTPEEIQADPRLQNALKDKINSDIYIAQTRSEAEGQGLEETTADEAQPGVQASTDPRAEHYADVDAVVSQIDQKATEELGRNLLGAMGVNADPQHMQQLQAALRNPQTTPAQRAEIQQTLDLVQNAGKIGSTLAKGAVDLIMTTIPSLLPQLLETAAPGMLGAYQGWQQIREVGQAWQKVAETRGANGQPLYPNLPPYQSKEYFDLVLKTERQLGQPRGWIGELNMPVDQKLAMIARVASGLQAQPKVRAQVVASAVSAGRQQERIQQARRTQGRAMGAGATSQQFEREESSDPVRDALKKAIAEQTQSGNPFAGATVRGA